ncbi:MAG: hypothetical protein HYU66_04050 [Armatimonadetes bacterium]|nr:hypothetical protein [Armatimonadota bacterium]
MIDANTLFGFWPLRRADISPETLVSTLKKHKLKAALTLSTTGIFADFQRGNEETLQVCGQSNGMLLPIGTIDPRRYVGSLEEIDKYLKQGVRVWRLFWEQQGFDLDLHPLTEILKRLAERGATLQVDATRRGDPSRIAVRTKPFGLRTILLGVDGRHVGELVSILGEHEQLLVETRRLADPQVVTALAQRFGATRLVFGTASPLQYVSSAKLPLEAAQLTDEQKALVMGGNVRALLAGTGA